MAAPIRNAIIPISHRLFSRILPSFNGLSKDQVCYASKRKNKRGGTKGKGRGIKRQDGVFVHKDEVLVVQLGLKYYPGENVEITRNNTLCAMCDGTVMISTEKLQPYPDSPLYEPVKKGVEIYKKFFHVVPAPLHGKFKLVSRT